MLTTDKLKMMKDIESENNARIEAWKKEKNMDKKITGILVDVEANTICKTTIDDSLKGYYSALKCDTIDIVSRHVGDLPVLVICDDEGLFKERPVMSAANLSVSPFIMEPVFVGNIFVCKHDELNLEELASLTDAECEYVLAHQKYLVERPRGASEGIRHKVLSILY